MQLSPLEQRLLTKRRLSEFAAAVLDDHKRGYSNPRLARLLKELKK